MSKSLKNFQTIQDALASTYTARNMRIVFLLSRWNDGVEISPDMRKQADNWETTLDNFFTNIKARLSEVDASSGIKDLSLSEDAGAKGLLEDFDQAKKDLDAALRNSFDTPTAMQVLLKLVRNANIYMNSSNSNVQALESVARWVTKIVGIFGLDANAQPPYEGGLGWSSATASNKANVDPQTAVKPYAAVFNQVKQEVAALDLSSGNESIKSLLEQQNPDSEFAELEKSGEKDAEKLALPFIRATSKLRDELRTTISSGAALDPKVKQAILALSDRIRDYDLTDLGVQLDDRVDGPSLVKFVPAAKLIQAREEKAALLAEKARQKEEGEFFCSSFFPLTFPH